jgi:hypothetical protein
MFNNTTIMDQKCAGLASAAAQTEYFIGYYLCCGSTDYSGRVDWRWSSIVPTTWINNASQYLSDSEPPKRCGCGRAHGGIDGPTS